MFRTCSGYIGRVNGAHITEPPFCLRHDGFFTRLDLDSIAMNSAPVHWKQLGYPTAMVGLLLLVACGDIFQGAVITGNGKPDTGSSRTDDWLIPLEEILGSELAKDNIPAINDPKFITATEIDYLEDDDLILGIKIGDTIRAYPHAILDWHEIINDQIGDVSFSVTYCPLTGSGMAWNRRIDGDTTSFGVSGMLYNTNLIPYDRATDSYWSQMKLQCVHGEYKGMMIETIPMIETSWATWKSMYPGSEVLSQETGYLWPYYRYPYGNYRTGDYLMYPISYEDTRLPRKQRVIGLPVENNAKTWDFDIFADSLRLLHDGASNGPLIIVGSKAHNFMVVYEDPSLDGSASGLRIVNGRLPIILTDNDANEWDIFGYATAGPRVGERLATTRAFMAYWFAWGAFYDRVFAFGIKNDNIGGN